MQNSENTQSTVNPNNSNSPTSPANSDNSNNVSKLGKVRIVLVGTTHPGNIGSAARAMKTMGLSELYLVTPKKFPSATATELAAGADDVLIKAKVFDNLELALSGCQVVIGTSARPRSLQLTPLVPRECAELAANTALADNPSDVAIVFGREHAGLTNEELMLCQYHVLIPSNPEYSSLNLAMAVQIICYECRLAFGDNQINLDSTEQLANFDELELFYQHLEQALIAIKFLNPENPRRLMPRFRRLFNRIHLETTEIDLLRGVLTKVDGAAANKLITTNTNENTAD